MAAVIDLTDVSSGDEENPRQRVASVATQLPNLSWRRARQLGGQGAVASEGVGGPVSGSFHQDTKPPHGSQRARKLEPRKGKADKNVERNGETVMEEGCSPSWGEPLPPEPDSYTAADDSPREGGACSTSDQTRAHTGSRQKSTDSLKRPRATLNGKSKFAGPASPVLNPPQAETGVCRHFWRAGDYEAPVVSSTRVLKGAMDHVRVHPKFLHSNATSHKWALGAVAELLDNAVDEVQNGASFVSVDKIVNPRDGTPALLVQDDGGGMTPDCMRQCMSLGYSRKTTNTTIGQYGNGFKTSTMRLGADVIVFSRSSHDRGLTQSIGLLSYTFLRKTGHEDVVVPMVDYEISRQPGVPPKMLVRSVVEDWKSNLSSIVQWSPYTSEAELLKQFDDLGWHGTKVIVYNLWFNDDGILELDFETDEQDIQLRGGGKQDKGRPMQTQLAQQHIANRYHHSLRVYASILYLQMPPGFQIILRGKPVEHHSIAADLKFSEQIIYKPQIGNSKDTNKETAVITVIGFTKEAPLVNVHGFNVYHKNRLIMPFWKVWQDNSSRGRGVVGVLEANFVEPAHDKQDFERTAVLLRLETRLKQMTVEYWNLHCHLIGYQPNTKAGKARARPPPAALDFPAPIASLTPVSMSRSVAEHISSHGAGTPELLGSQTDLLSPSGVRSIASSSTLNDLSQAKVSLSQRICKPSSTAGETRAGPGSQAPPVPDAGTAPSTPPQPNADGLKSTNGEHGEGQGITTRQSDAVVPQPTVKVEYDSVSNLPDRTISEIASFETAQRKRQRIVSGSGLQTISGVGRESDGSFAVPRAETAAVMVELYEENTQLRLRCVEYDHREKELESKVADQARELVEAAKEIMVVKANLLEAKVQFEKLLDEKTRIQKQLEDKTRKVLDVKTELI